LTYDAETGGFIARSFAIQLPETTVVELDTNIVVPNQGVVLCGGLMIDNRTIKTSTVPILSDLPLIGRTFRNRNYMFNKVNTIIAVHGEIFDMQ